MIRLVVIAALTLLIAPVYVYALPACPSLTTTIRRGSTDVQTGGSVTALQQFLVSFYNLEPDVYVSGFFGPKTAALVTRFQTEHAVSALGIVGPATRLAIQTQCEGTVATVVASTTPAKSGHDFQLMYRPVGQNVSHVEFLFSPDRPDYTAGSSIYDTHYTEYAIDFGDGFTKFFARSCTETGDCIASTSHTYLKSGTYIARLLYSPKSAQKQCVTALCRLKTFKKAVATTSVVIGTPRSSLEQEAPTVNIWYNELIGRGNAAQIRWETGNVNRCVIQYQGIEETVPTKGSRLYYPASTTQYAMWCANDVGTPFDGKDVYRPFTVRVQ